MTLYRYVFYFAGFLLVLPGNNIINAQSKYELLFISGQFDSLLIETSQLDHADDYLWRSLVLKKQGFGSMSADLLNKGSAIYPENDELREQLIRTKFDLGQYSGLRDLLYNHQEKPEFFLMLISVLEFEDRHTEAIALLNNRISEDSTNSDYPVLLANNYYQIDSLKPARNWYIRALKINPGDQVSKGKLANIYLMLKAYDESIEICDEALSIDSTNRRFIRIKGFANFRKGNFAEAVTAFSYLLEKGDSSLVILKHLGISESKNYAFHDSREHLLIAHVMDTSDQEICFFLGRGFLNSTEPEKGLYYLEKAEELIQPDPEILAAIYIEKVSIYNCLQMYDEVLDLYLRAYRINPRPDYLFSLGSLYEYRFNSKKKALEYYERFLKELPPRDTPYPATRTGQQSLSMKNIAEEKVILLKEALFFQGELDHDE